nr:MAG: hypothetical protein DIU70_10490 [Bacillota bacterium]
MSLEVWVRRPDTLHLEILSPDGRSLPTAEALEQRLANAGMQLERVRIRFRAGREVMSATVHPVEGSHRSEGHLPLGELARAVGDSLQAPLQELRVVAPRFLAFAWSGSSPSRTLLDRWNYAEYLFQPAPTTGEVHARFYPGPDLPARARQVGLWAVLPFIVGAAMGWVASRQSAKMPPGRLPVLAYLIFPAVMLASCPFQALYNQWVAPWVEWQFRSPVLGGVVGFLPIALVLLGVATPLWRLAYRSRKGLG